MKKHDKTQTIVIKLFTCNLPVIISTALTKKSAKPDLSDSESVPVRCQQLCSQHIFFITYEWANKPECLLNVKPCRPNII
jgi:hypothetical protein